MVKIQNGIATREPLPQFLRGLDPESLADLSWTDPALGVSDCAWWPEEVVHVDLPDFHKWSGETLTPVKSRKVIKSKKVYEPMNQEDIENLQAEFYQQMVVATQDYLDKFAQEKGFDNILSACTYATSLSPEFWAWGNYAVEARDSTWAKLKEIENDVRSGKRPTPLSFEDIKEELPKLVWPE